jgi:hypothetical protein
MQADSSKQFYSLERIVPTLKTQVLNSTGIVSGLLDRAPDVPRRRFVDIGAGTGAVSAAACAEFDEAWALELNRWTLAGR